MPHTAVAVPIPRNSSISLFKLLGVGSKALHLSSRDFMSCLKRRAICNYTTDNLTEKVKSKESHHYLTHSFTNGQLTTTFIEMLKKSKSTYGAYMH